MCNEWTSFNKVPVIVRFANGWVKNANKLAQDNSNVWQK